MQLDGALAEAKLLWFAARKASRDSKLKVGSLVKQWLADKLLLASTMNEEQRIKAGLARCSLIDFAAKHLGVSPHTTNCLVHTSAAVELMADSGECGELSYSTVRAMRVMVGKPLGKSARSLRGVRSGAMTVAQKETWVVKEPADKHVEYFRTAVLESWPHDRVVAGLPVCAKGPARKQPAVDVSPVEHTLKSLARAGTPRDVAELVLDLLSECDPLVTELVLSQLNNYVRC